MRGGSARSRSFGRAICFGSRRLRRMGALREGEELRADKRNTRPPRAVCNRGQEDRHRTGGYTMATQLTSTGIQEHEVVSPKEWIASRKELLRKEKEFNKQRDELSRQRRELPWERVEKQYVFDGPNGKETLADLFDGRS